MVAFLYQQKIALFYKKLFIAIWAREVDLKLISELLQNIKKTVISKVIRLWFFCIFSLFIVLFKSIYSSPDCSVNPFIFSLKIKDCNGKQEVAPKNYWDFEKSYDCFYSRND